jgi:RNA polymerase sigma-70 factor (ECF subfamily)
LLSIVRNRGIDLLRSSASRRRTQYRAEAAALTSQSSGVFAETWYNPQCERIREALSYLPPEQLKVLELAYFSGYTHAEIAELMSLLVGTIKGRMR